MSKVLIIGAGPAGLSLGNIIKDTITDNVIVLEKEESAGGLCRSVEVDGYPLDIGGGHFLDTRRPHVNKFLFRYMPESEWVKYNRNTTIKIKGNVIGQPIESHIWQMKLEDQVEYLKSIAIAGCNLGEPIPEKFREWIYWKLGKKITEEYMIPYNQKIFGQNMDLLGTYWLDKLPNVSFEETLLSCLEHKPYGKDPGHTQFYYPKKYGYGELWLRMAYALGDRIVYKKAVKSIDFTSKTVITSDGSKFYGDIIVTTIPWNEYDTCIGMPNELKGAINELLYSSIQIEYFPENMDTKSQWIYVPDDLIPYHRILVRHNFCPNSKGYWTETNSERIKHSDNKDNFKHLNKYGYPLNTILKPKIMKRLLDWCKSKSVYGLGRWGEHNHYNSDVVVELAMKMADELRGLLI